MSSAVSIPTPTTGQVVPLTSSPNQTLTVQLQVDGAPLTLQLGVWWNAMAGYWMMSISSASGVLLLDAVPMITGWYPSANLLAQYEYLQIGSAYIVNVGSTDSDYPGQTDLGTNFILIWDDTSVTS